MQNVCHSTPLIARFWIFNFYSVLITVVFFEILIIITPKKYQGSEDLNHRTPRIKLSFVRLLRLHVTLTLISRASHHPHARHQVVLHTMLPSVVTHINHAGGVKRRERVVDFV